MTRLSHRIFWPMAIMASLLAASTVGAGVNEWTPQGPLGGTIRTLAVDAGPPARVYAGTATGLYVSINQGNTWTAVDAVGIAEIRAIAIFPGDPATIYASGVGGVFKSTDGGDSWQNTSDGMTNRIVYSLAVDPTSVDIVYAGTVGGLFKSNNGGASWFAINNGITDRWIYSLAIDPSTPSTVTGS